MISALLIQGVPIECINHAAVTYYVPAKLIISILNTEGGKTGLAKRNKNGTLDLGNMQINSVWLPQLSRYGYTAFDLQYDPCKNVDAGTWILSQRIAHSGRYWKGIGDYHSFTPLNNTAYQQKVARQYQHIEKIVDDQNERF